MTNEALSREYSRILEKMDESFLDPDHPDSKTTRKTTKGLSGLFLASVSSNYASSKNKIMVIGRETRGWKVLKEGDRFLNRKDYVRKSMKHHNSFFEREINKKNAKGNTFHNFMRSVARKSGKEGLIYANLFCFDWQEKSPQNSPFFEDIKIFSEELLKAQIDVLRPDIIIMANGMSSVDHRRDYFPISGDNKVCLNSRDYANEGIDRRQLWEFDLYGRIRCFRIHHPSARAKKTAEARNFLVDLLPNA